MTRSAFNPRRAAAVLALCLLGLLVTLSIRSAAADPAEEAPPPFAARWQTRTTGTTFPFLALTPFCNKFTH
jgi:hypothetical protein